jgi:hypothetical protein
MSESSKTMAFLAVAILAVIAALATRPASSDVDVQSLVGKVLTRNFTNLDDAKRLRIARFDKDTSQVHEFEVAEEDGLWVIPSKDGYPADAQRQMAEAATSLMDRKILDVASNEASDHEQYGVIDPLSPKLDAGQAGVGTRVTLSDVHNDPLVDLIIGREVKDAPNQRYAREASRDVVYVIEFDPTKLTTNFEDWIEKDLLKINPWDLAQVEIKDYSAELQPVMMDQGLAIQVAWEPRSDLTLGYNDQEAKWSPVRLQQYDTNAANYVDFQLADDQQLNDEKLNGLKTALDDLRIVDVVRKPQGLSEDLQAGEDFLTNPEAKRDLRSRGFAAVPLTPGGEEEIVSSDGELIATTTNGAEYVLRFGDLTSADNGPKDDGAPKADDPAASKSDVNRYLFIMARMNEDVVAKPELEQLPELPGEPASAGGDPAASDAKPEAATEESATETAEADAAASDAESEATSEDESDDTDEGTAADSDEAALAQSDAKSAEVKKIIAERKRIETDNQRKLDEYQNKLKQGRETVAELNARFGDWYFVVSNDVFNKLRLGRDDVIEKKKSDEPAAADGNDAVTSPFGVPGATVPGLPEIPGAGP